LDCHIHIYANRTAFCLKIFAVELIIAIFGISSHHSDPMGPPPPLNRTTDAFICASLSRLALLGIVLISVFVISPLPYDTSVSLVFRGSSTNSSSGDSEISIQEAWNPSLLIRILSRLASWDALYFTSIAEKGYLWEHYHAFFPGYPTMMKFLADSTNTLIPFMMILTLI
jgi:hypothetical protein